ncbi:MULTISPECIES: helix-turn-helix transcriptional regulator [unclassified Streptomyces]|uniref:helix-turn-helix domain-containing protein n=1 Tax=unclassified Streptomyces TaxID=2593676 RepID=UPI00225874E2|nr:MULTISPECIES: helix-turn-helix transcriptional regulator [unclassified Streptomyces]MCX4550703.1 helix-turn-helix transcriptional regulator [Streptomyces sp. NBC_01500]WSC22141.1 helix-turn-helix transcriptional regulator [Streptomyces sp. NBC_01766]WSV55989.1 helix-turn-helix transcriptional regulator [Streptomyces sp. NBC_01014]
MATAMPPTLRQRRLGTELRKLRERAGLSSTAAAAEVGIQQARMSMIEAGRYAVSADRVRALASAYACPDTTLVEALAAMTGGRGRGWWDEYRELLPASLVEVAEFEHYATELRVGVVVAMAGLVQTLEHARVAFQQSVPTMHPHEIEHRVSFRVKRQAVLHSSPPTPYTAIVHEAALRMGFGGPDIMRDQLSHLIAMSERDNVRILVVPFDRPHFPASGQPISYASGPVPQLDTVLLDSDHGCEFLDAEAQVYRYRSVLDRMETCALPPGKSRDFIRQIAKAI